VHEVNAENMPRFPTVTKHFMWKKEPCHPIQYRKKVKHESTKII
jgi:hypothetical protein